MLTILYDLLKTKKKKLGSDIKENVLGAAFMTLKIGANL